MSNTFLPIIAGNYVARITQTIVQETTQGNITPVNLIDDLPAEIIQAINSNYPVYAILGCRKNGTVEYVQIEKGSYQSQDRRIRLVRGQSPYFSSTGGQAIRHTATSSGGISLDFNTTYPYGYRQLVDTVSELKDNTLKFVTNNIPKATTTTVGAVQVSYNNPEKQANTAYRVITQENPLVQQILQSLLDLSPTSQTLQLDGSIDSASVQKIDSLRKLSKLLLSNPAKLDAFIAWYNKSF